MAPRPNLGGDSIFSPPGPLGRDVLPFPKVETATPTITAYHKRYFVKLL